MGCISNPNAENVMELLRTTEKTGWALRGRKTVGHFWLGLQLELMGPMSSGGVGASALVGHATSLRSRLLVLLT